MTNQATLAITEPTTQPTGKSRRRSESAVERVNWPATTILILCAVTVLPCC